ncbi:MAG: methyltransferase [Deltaproteobacteria bacterium]|nr:methyltransferase [Deltaproteobacteria bacterium]
MSSHRKKDFIEYGIRVFRSRHNAVRKLKRLHSPSMYGFRVWPSSWLLIDYFKRMGLAKRSKILDIGCGWGLAGIYCAKNHNSSVTCVDRDSEVFPYLRLHAETNKVKITTMETGFEELSCGQLKSYELMMGADICFWNEMVESLKNLIARAFESHIETVVIADQGRSSFESLGRYFVEKGKGEIINWEVTHPHTIEGRILRIKRYV